MMRYCFPGTKVCDKDMEIVVVVDGTLKVTLPPDRKEQQVFLSAVSLFDLKFNRYIWPKYISKSLLFTDKTSSMYL